MVVHAAPSPEAPTLETIRRLLLGILLLGSLGMGAELLLIGHVESATQLIPVVGLALGAAGIAWLALAPRPAAVLSVRVLMTAFLVSGITGVVLHYRGNAAFEREIYPEMAGMELVRHTLTGATPVLAPGSMAILGLVGLAATYRHPARAARY